MNKSVAKCLAFLVLAFLVSCSGDSIYAGFTKTDHGAYMKFYERSGETVSPRLNDGVSLEMAQYFRDSLLFTTAGDEPLYVVLEPGAFVGDVTDAIMSMHVGDSARVVMLADSVFVHAVDADVPEDCAGLPLYYDIKLLSIKPYEEIEAERRHHLDGLRSEEQALLEPFRNNAQNTVTESGMIILEKKGKGIVPQKGDFVIFDFSMCTLDGDTLLNSFGIESLEVQYGSDEIFAKGFTEALGCLPKGGSISAILPSSIAYDSIGYPNLIAPFTPVHIFIQMNDIMDGEAYANAQKEKEEKRLAELEKAMEKERQLIAKYAEDNGITEQPFESGLYLIWDELGSGDVTKWGDKVAIFYTIYNLNGELVDSNYPENVPMQFTIGNNEMIYAVEEAVMEMNPGSKVRLIVPSNIGFGEYEIDPEKLPAYSPFVMDVELVSIE